MPHTVLKVQLRSTAEAWIVDTAGIQYGFRDVLVPFNKYIADHQCRVVSGPNTYNSTETKDVDYYATLEFMDKMRAQREDLHAERKARLHFAGFVDSDVRDDLLAGSAAEWQGKRDGFGHALKVHLLKYVV